MLNNRFDLLKWRFETLVVSKGPKFLAQLRFDKLVVVRNTLDMNFDLSKFSGHVKDIYQKEVKFQVVAWFGYSKSDFSSMNIWKLQSAVK